MFTERLWIVILMYEWCRLWLENALKTSKAKSVIVVCNLLLKTKIKFHQKLTLFLPEMSHVHRVDRYRWFCCSAICGFTFILFLTFLKMYNPAAAASAPAPALSTNPASPRSPMLGATSWGEKNAWRCMHVNNGFYPNTSIGILPHQGRNSIQPVTFIYGWLR